MSEFDPTKPVQTGDGHTVEIYRTDAGGDYPILGAIYGVDGRNRWHEFRWNERGSPYINIYGLRLINAPDLHEEVSQMTFDPTKPTRLRNGWEWRLYATDGGGDYPIHGAFHNPRLVGWTDSKWARDGRWVYATGASKFDIINVPVKHRLRAWINVSAGGTRAMYDSRKVADQCAAYSRIACLEIDREFEEGEGL